MNAKQQKALTALNQLCQEDQVEVVAKVLTTPKFPSVAVDLTPFRERYLILHAREGLTAIEAAERMGWFYGHGSNGTRPKGDGTRLLRRLGLAADNGGKGYYSVRRFANYETAVALCEALQLDYTDVNV